MERDLHVLEHIQHLAVISYQRNHVKFITFFFRERRKPHAVSHITQRNVLVIFIFIFVLLSGGDGVKREELHTKLF